MATFRGTSDRNLTDPLAALRREVSDADEPAQVVQERQVRRIERELQNRRRREAQQSLEECRNGFADRHDCAPVGSAILHRHGQVTAMNLVAAQVLGSFRRRRASVGSDCMQARPDCSSGEKRTS